MPHAWRIAEQQHVCDNTSKDVHKEMKHFPVYYKHLKLYEDFFKEPSRVRRYVWTCLRHTADAGFENVVGAFSARMYEARWKEVVILLDVC